MAVEDGAGTVAHGMQRDRLAAGRAREERLQRLCENARAAGLAAAGIGSRRLEGVVLHVVPERTAERSSEALESTIPPVAQPATESEPILDHLEGAGFPDEVDRVDAVVQPPAVGALRIPQRRLLAHEAAVGVQHQARAG